MTSKHYDLVMGLGEIGIPILKVLKKSIQAIGFDIDPQKMDQKHYETVKDNPISLIHFCIPYTDNFESIVIKTVKEKNPQGIVIHSTIKPYTTEHIQKALTIPVIYSATRGVHKRMIKDLQRYTKFYSVYDWAPNAKWVIKTYSNRMKKAGIKTKRMSTPLTLELAKILIDTSYYGWLINYAQLTNMIAVEHKVNYDEMWTFSDEIHKFLGNRPKMFPGFIGGHCVLPNLDLMHDKTLDLIKQINDNYKKTLNNKK
ncbi:hypothetical protein [Candidatus Nitrosotenuis chungbukensis]|uniref:hypothetical protein n=1 Tax=Candidatus Nitrosotenuis chungbukensis TaxID=1353246 RepID=UPI001EE643F8|nr:hypothetical protein [Candidatus Nitrosotenuis chungbukensis]